MRTETTFVPIGPKVTNQSAADRLCNPLTALQAAPGGGKSFFLDEVAALKEEDLNKLCQPHEDDPPEFKGYNWEKIRSIMRNMQPVSVTYNGESTLSPKEQRAHPECSLALRMLFGYFIRQTPWQTYLREFTNKFPAWPDLTVEIALNTIVKHSGKGGVLLCIDELVKASPEGSTDQKEVKQLLTTVGTYLSSCPPEKFCAVISTLDVAPISQVKTASGRPIDWIPLPPLSREEADDLFSSLLAQVEDKKRRLFLRGCIAECGGHPRSLERLYSRMNNVPGALLDYDAQALMAPVCEQLYQYYDNPKAYELIKVALRGELFPLTEEINYNGRHPLSYYITLGYFSNQLESVTEERTVVPRIPPMVLRCFAHAPAVAKSEGDVRAVAECLRKMFAQTANFTGYSYETFHAWWEVLNRIVRKTQGDETLASLYDIESEDSEGLPQIHVNRKTKVQVLEGYFPPPNTTGMTAEALMDLVVMPEHKNNRGLDTAIFEKKSSGHGYISININTKHSQMGAKTYLTRASVESAKKKMDDAYAPHVEGGAHYGKSPVGQLGLAASDVYLVIPSWRKVSEKWDTIPERVIILRREQLKSLYSPSLYPIPQHLHGNNI